MSIDEKCPICGTKMDRGYLQNKYGIYWHKVNPARRKSFGKESDSSMWKVAKLHGYRCEHCKIIRYLTD